MSAFVEEDFLDKGIKKEDVCLDLTAHASTGIPDDVKSNSMKVSESYKVTGSLMFSQNIL